MNYAAWRAYDEFAAGILANVASRSTESSPLRSATLTCARRCAPSSVHSICWCFAIRWLTTWLTPDSAMLLLIGSPLRGGSRSHEHPGIAINVAAEAAPIPPQCRTLIAFSRQQ